MGITDLISAIWKRSKLSKVEFCEKMAISRQTLDNWLNKDKFPNANDLERASKILDVPVFISLDKEEVSVSDYIDMSKQLARCLKEKESVKKNTPIPSTKPELKI